MMHGHWSNEEMHRRVKVYNSVFHLMTLLSKLGVVSATRNDMYRSMVKLLELLHKLEVLSDD